MSDWIYNLRENWTRRSSHSVIAKGNTQDGYRIFQILQIANNCNYCLQKKLKPENIKHDNLFSIQITSEIHDSSSKTYREAVDFWKRLLYNWKGTGLLIQWLKVQVLLLTYYGIIFSLQFYQKKNIFTRYSYFEIIFNCI